MRLKKTDWIKKYIKLKLAFPEYSSIFYKLNNENVGKRAIVFGTPVHSNLGDHLIAEECMWLANKLGYSDIIEIPEFIYELFPDKFFLRPEDDLFIVGGGWMGDLYEDEVVIEELIRRFSKNNIIILPQTIQFKKQQNAEQLKKFLHDSKNCLVCVRERNSLSVCRKLLGLNDTNSILLPDMALIGLDKVSQINRRNTKNIIISLREDCEKVVSDSASKEIINYLKNKGYVCRKSSTVVSSKVVQVKKRTAIIAEKIKDYANADIVITDRLHSMVFALLAGTKCIAIDNSTHKISGVYSAWLHDYKGVFVAKKVSQITPDIIDGLLNLETQFVTNNYVGEFSKLCQKINERDELYEKNK